VNKDNEVDLKRPELFIDDQITTISDFKENHIGRVS